MGGKRKLTDADITVIRDLHDRGMKPPALAERFNVTAETIRTNLKRIPQPTPEPESILVEEVIAEAEAAVEDDSTDEGTLEDQIRRVKGYQRAATTDAAKLTCSRLLMQLAEKRFKMRPEAAPDLNVRPDYQRAAAEVRAKLHELLDRAMAGSE